MRTPHSLSALRRTLISVALGASLLGLASPTLCLPAHADTTSATASPVAEQPVPTLSIAASRTELTLGSYALTITGTLLDADGRPWAGQRVALLEQSWLGRRLVKEDLSDADGRVELNFGGYTADYHLLATDPDTGFETASPVIHVSLVVETGIYPDETDPADPSVPGDSNHVRGTLAARFGPVPEATVELWQREQDDLWTLLATDTTDADGRYDLAPEPSLGGEGEVRYAGGVWQYFTTTPASAEQHIPAVSSPSEP